MAFLKKTAFSPLANGINHLCLSEALTEWNILWLVRSTDGLVRSTDRKEFRGIYAN